MGSRARTQACIDLQIGATVLARYFVQGNNIEQGGNLEISKIQLQIPPAPTCAWQQAQPGQPNNAGYDLSNNAAQ
jgi:hypothetical protein